MKKGREPFDSRPYGLPDRVFTITLTTITKFSETQKSLLLRKNLH